MKTLICLSRIWGMLLAMAACALGDEAWREFKEAEGGRSFVGQLVSYDPVRREANIRMKAGGSQTKIAIDKLSQADQKFVKEEVQKLDAARYLSIKFDKVQEKSGESTKNSETAKTTTSKYSAGYRIALGNYAPNPIGGVTVEYLVIWKQDSLKGGGKEKSLKGERKLNLIPNGGTETISTETVTLEAVDQEGKTVRNRNKQGGKTTSRTHPSANSRDTLAGCVVWVKVGGKIVKTEATSPPLLSRYGKGGN